MEIILTIIRFACVGAVYFLLGGLLLGLTASVMLLVAYLWSLVTEKPEKRANIIIIKKTHVNHDENDEDKYAQLHAEINAFLAQMLEES